MKRNLIFCVCLLLMSCSMQKAPADPNQQLKTAISEYLNSDPKSKDKYHYDITSLIYFEDPRFYICEFKVHMTSIVATPNAPKVDTTGAMKVKIDKNFKVIGRYY